MSFIKLQKKLNKEREKLEKYLNTIFEDSKIEVIENRYDDDIKVRVINNDVSEDSLENLRDYFDIVYINVDGTSLELDLREK